jgi:Kdo2-lipid IVA lauroyltransferase/acyltransferase
MKQAFSTIAEKIILMLSKLPFGILYFFSDLFFFIGSYVIRYRLKVILKNLRMAFPDKTDRFYKKTARRFHRHFADVFTESLKNLNGNPNDIFHRINIKNPEMLKAFYDRGQSIILYGAHIGNWEWLSILPKHAPHKIIAFYKPLSNQLIDKLVKDSREKYGVTTTPSAKAFKLLKGLNDEGIPTLTIALGDQSPSTKGPKVWIDFLGIETAFLPGTNKIAQRLGQATIYPHFTKTGRGFYELEFKIIHNGSNPITDDHMIANYARLLEDNIRQQPHIWLWSHRRWKHSPAGAK